jgi:hypothetical protein
MEFEAKNRPKTMQQWLAFLEPPIQPKISRSSKTQVNSQLKTLQVVGSFVAHTMPWGNPFVKRTIPWGWLVWNASIYAAIGTILEVAAAPRVLVAGANFLAGAWALGIAGRWAIAWATTATTLWLLGVVWFIGVTLYAINSLFGLAWGIFVILAFLGTWFFALDKVEAMIRAWTHAWNITKKDLLNSSSFSKQHTFLILAITNWLGLFLGKLLYKLLR